MFLPAPVILATVNLTLYYGYLVPRLGATGAPFYAAYWANYGPTAITAAVGMLRHPIQVLASTLMLAIFQPRSSLPHLYLPVIGWRWVVGIVPVIVLYSVSANEQLRSFGIYYAIVLVPFLVLGTARGAERSTGVLIHAPRTRACCGKRCHRARRATRRDLQRRLQFEAMEGRKSARFPHSCGHWEANRLCWCRAACIRTPAMNPAFKCSPPRLCRDPRYAGAAVVLAPGLSGYPLTTIDFQKLAQLPSIAVGNGLVAIRRPD